MFDRYDPRVDDNSHESQTSQDSRDRDDDDDAGDASAAGPASIDDGRDLDRDRDHEIDGDRSLDRDRDDGPPDQRDLFLHNVDLPRGDERETVFDRDRCYEINGNESRTLATVGAFRIVPESDLRDARDESLGRPDDDLRHLRDEGLIHTVQVDERERAVVLTDRGRDLLEQHRHDRGDGHHQEFYAEVSRPRELSHDSQIYGAFRAEEARLRDQGAEISRVVLEQELKRDYQCFLQERNRDRPDSDGRPDRDPEEIEGWAHDHDLPYFDESVHFPDLRIEYELDGRELHVDVEVVTENYRGGHAASRARSGFSCYGSAGGRSGGGRTGAGLAEEFL